MNLRKLFQESVSTIKAKISWNFFLTDEQVIFIFINLPEINLKKRHLKFVKEINLGQMFRLTRDSMLSQWPE